MVIIKNKSKSRIAKSKREVKGYTSILNRVIRDSRLTNKEYRVLIVLISYYNQEEGISYPSAERIEQEARITRKTRKKIIKKLIRKHRIKRIFRSGTTNAYIFPCLPFPENTEKKTRSKKKKPYYENQEMRFSSGKWWVINKYNEWLEFADSENKIEWK